MRNVVRTIRSAVSLRPLPTLLAIVSIVGLMAPGSAWADNKARADKAADGQQAFPSVDSFSDPLELLAPRVPRSEQDADRVHAAALYAHGRLLFQRREFAKALPRFERAWRYDESLVPLMPEVVRLAFSLNRSDEATRYAVLAAEQDKDADPALLEDLAGVLLRRNEVDRAIAFYERAHQRRQEQPRSPQMAVLLMKMGRLFALLQRYPEATRHFETLLPVLDKPGEFGLTEPQLQQLIQPAERSLRLIGQCFLETGKTDAARELFQQAHQRRPDAPMLAFDLARLAQAKKDYPGAHKQLLAYLQAPDAAADVLPYRLLESVCEQLHPDQPYAARKELIEQLQKARETTADCGPLNLFLADKLAKSDPKQAAALYREVTGEPAEGQAWVGLAQLAFEQRDEPLLLEALGELVTRKLPLGQVAAAKSLMEETERWESLGESLRAADKPPRGSALALALLAVGRKDYPAADQWFAQAAEQAGRDKRDVLTTWGATMLGADQYPLAVAAFQKAVAAVGNRQGLGEVLLYLAGAQALNGNTEDALRSAKRAAALNADDPQYHARIAWILYHDKQYEEAEQRYRALIDRFDRSHETDAQRSALRQARLMLSNICTVQGRLDEAVEWTEQVLDEFPEDVGALNDLGYLWADHGLHLERALKMTQRAVAGRPDSKAYRDSLGWAYFRLGKFDEALKELELASDDEQPDGVILDHLADVYAALGRAEDARKTWTRAVDLLRESGEEEKLKAVQAKLEAAKP